MVESCLDPCYAGSGLIAWVRSRLDRCGSFLTASYAGYVTPAQRHAGDDQNILAARHLLYTQARELNPARWSGNTRNWSPVGAVTLNPERDSIIKTSPVHNDIQQLAA